MKRIDIAEKSYCEVLDATKHQDDKVGRILTAAAFLTTGALALVTFTFAASTELVLPHARLPIVAIGVGLFLGSTAFAVVALLLSLSTPHVYLSDFWKNYRSLIFFHEIGRYSNADWETLWTKDEVDLSLQLEANFVAESLNLARRIKLKYKRTYEAVHVFQTGVLYLALGAIAFLFGFAASPGSLSKPSPIYPTYLVRSVFLIGILSYLWLQLVAISDQARYDKKDWNDLLANQRYQRRTTARLTLGALLSLVWLELVLVLLPLRLTPWTVPIVVAGGLGFLALRRPLCERTEAIDGQCREIDGGPWRGSWSRRRLYIGVAFAVWLATLALGLVVSVVGSPAAARFATAASVPLLVMAAGFLQRTLSRSGTAAPGPGTNSTGDANGPRTGGDAGVAPSEADGQSDVQAGDSVGHQSAVGRSGPAVGADDEGGANESEQEMNREVVDEGGGRDEAIAHPSDTVHD